MKVDMIKDIVMITATGGALLLGLGKFIGEVQKVPNMERRLSRVEGKARFLVAGMEKLTKTKYDPRSFESARAEVDSE